MYGPARHAQILSYQRDSIVQYIYTKSQSRPCGGTHTQSGNNCRSMQVVEANTLYAQVDSKEDDQNLTKVVLARRTDVEAEGDVDALGLLQTLQVGPLTHAFMR